MLGRPHHVVHVHLVLDTSNGLPLRVNRRDLREASSKDRHAANDRDTQQTAHYGGHSRDSCTVT